MEDYQKVLEMQFVHLENARSGKIHLDDYFEIKKLKNAENKLSEAQLQKLKNWEDIYKRKMPFDYSNLLSYIDNFYISDKKGEYADIHDKWAQASRVSKAELKKQIKENFDKYKEIIILTLIFSVLLFIANGNRQYGYYQFLRVISLLYAGTVAFLWCKKSNTLLNFVPICAIIIGILFNPFFIFAFNSGTWKIIDLIAGFVCILEAIYLLFEDVKRASRSANRNATVR